MFACLVCTIGVSSGLFPCLGYMSTHSGRIFQAMNTETAREDRDGTWEMAEGDVRHAASGWHDTTLMTKAATTRKSRDLPHQVTSPAHPSRHHQRRRRGTPSQKESIPWPGNAQREPSPASDTASYAPSPARSSSESPPSSVPASRPGSANKSYDTSAPETPYSRHFSPVPETGPKTVSSAALSINPSRSTDDVASRIQMVRFHQRR